MIKKILVFSLLIMTLQVSAQTGVPKFSDAVKLTDAINSEAEESLPLYDAVNKRLYFVRTFHKQNKGGKMAGQDIWMAEGEAEKWTKAHNNFPLLNNEHNNAVVGISGDGQRLYLLNQYAGKNRMKAGVSIQRADTLTAESIFIPDLKIEGNFYGFFVNAEENVILISADIKGGVGEEDLYVTLKDANGNWSAPKNLGSMINTSGYEISPFLDADGKTLFYSTSGRGGLGGADIFMTTRLDDSWTKWSLPQNLGRKINSRGFDAYLSKYGDRIFFCSDRSGEHSDIYTIRVMSVEELNALLPPKREIYFALNAYMVNNESKAVLDDIIRILKDNQDFKVVFSGFTCNLGDEARNKKLSESRATTASDYLQILGVSKSRIVINAYGEFHADKAEQDEETQSKFRKVEISFMYLDM